MASNQKSYRKLSKSGGGSYYVVLPAELIRGLKWKERQKLVVQKSGSKILIQDWKK